MSYGQKFKEIRRANLLSQEEFATRIGVSRSIVSQIEIDKIKPTLETLRSVAQAFEVSLDYLMSNEQPLADNDIMLSESRALMKPHLEPTRHYLMHESPRKTWSRTKHSALHHPHLQRVPYFSLANRIHFKGVPILAVDKGFEQLVLPLTITGVPTIAIDATEGLYHQGELLICAFHQLDDMQQGDLYVITTAEFMINGKLRTVQKDEIRIHDRVIAKKEIQEAWKIIRVMAEPEKMVGVMEKLEEIRSILMKQQDKE